jgi:hypothetical protein
MSATSKPAVARFRLVVVAFHHMPKGLRRPRLVIADAGVDHDRAIRGAQDVALDAQHEFAAGDIFGLEPGAVLVEHLLSQRREELERPEHGRLRLDDAMNSDIADADWRDHGRLLRARVFAEAASMAIPARRVAFARGAVGLESPSLYCNQHIRPPGRTSDAEPRIKLRSRGLYPATRRQGQARPRYVSSAGEVRGCKARAPPGMVHNSQGVHPLPSRASRLNARERQGLYPYLDADNQIQLANTAGKYSWQIELANRAGKQSWHM